jgi:hypothetical protein
MVPCIQTTPQEQPSLPEYENSIPAEEQIVGLTGVTVNHLQPEEILSQPKYETGQSVMYCFLPAIGYHMTDGESPYALSSVVLIESEDNKTIIYTLHVPGLNFQPRLSEKALIKMQEFVEYLQQTGQA